MSLRSAIDPAVIATVTDPTSGAPQLLNAFLSATATLPLHSSEDQLARWPMIVIIVIGALTIAETAVLMVTKPQTRARLSSQVAALATRSRLRVLGSGSAAQPKLNAAHDWHGAEEAGGGAPKNRAAGVLEQAIAAAEPATDMTTEMRQLLAILRDVSDRLAALEQRMS